MAKKRDYHVVPRPAGWAVIKEKAKRASSVHEGKAAAMKEGRRLAKKDEVELVEHKENSKIRDSDSYGNDPHPPRARKH